MQSAVTQRSEFEYYGARWWGIGGYEYTLPWADRQERQAYLARLRYHPQNTLFQSAALSVQRQVAGVPWEISGERRVDWFQSILMNADRGRGWASFLSKLIFDFLTLDDGAVIEVIGFGPTDTHLSRELVSGLGILDPLRCYFTDNDEFPVWYQDIYGEMHKMHRTRVIRLVDMPMSAQEVYGRGFCALSRAVAWVQQSITLMTYTGEMLNNQPPAGILNVGHVSNPKNFQDAYEQYIAALKNANESVYKPVFKYVEGMTAKAEIEFVPFASAPPNFDAETYTRLQAQGIASAMGIDPQDILPLVGGSFGTNTQSKVLDRKAHGRTLGYLLQEIERKLNALVLPDDLEFAFKHKDSEESARQADEATKHMQVAAQLATLTDKRAALQYLANTVEAFADVLLDEDGQVRLYDDDPKPAGQPAYVVVADDTQGEVAPNAPVAQDDVAQKELDNTEFQFARDYYAAAMTGIDKTQDRRRVGIILRALVQRYGRQFMMDGLRDGGVLVDVLEGEDKRTFDAWYRRQSVFVTNFANNLYQDNITAEQVRAHVDMWVNKSMREIYLAGVESADRNGLYMWMLGPTEEHCTDCAYLNGQVHRMKQYINSGFLPGAEQLECKGYQCKCRLQKVAGQRARGRWPKASKHVHNHAA
jgi:hypothetical protein